VSIDRRMLLTMAALAAVAVGACGTAATPSETPHELSLLASSGAAEPAIYPQPTVTYLLDGRLANLGPVAEVRKLVGHEMTAADLARIGEALGLHGTPLRTATGWELRSGEAVLTVSTTGGVPAVDYSSTGGAAATPGSAGGGSARGAGTGATSGPSNPSTAVSSPPTISPIAAPPTAAPTGGATPIDVPSADVAVGIAQSLLDGMGVLSGQQWSHEVSDAGSVAISCAAGMPCTAAPAPVSARIVTYELVVAGVTVPDVSWSVTIGQHRSIESVSGTWARPESAGTYPLRSTQKVFDDLRSGNARYPGPQPLPAVAAPGASVTPGSPPAIVVHITGVSLGMALWNGLEKGQSVVYILPTYRFHAHAAGGSPYEIELLALDPGRFTFVTPPAPGGPTGGVVPPYAATPVSGEGPATEDALAADPLGR